MREPEGPGHPRSLRWPRFLRVTLVVGTTFAVSALLWLTLERLLASSRGVDLSDEGLYLLAADPPSASAAWGFPSGWHVHPLFALVRYDIASFRTLGALILVTASAWLGWSAARATLGRDEPKGRATTFLFLGALGASAGSFMFYAPMLRTPGYNWSNLVGLTVSAAATLTAVTLADSRGHERSPRATRAWFAILAAVASLSLFSTFPAKPTTLPLMVVISSLVVLLAVNLRAAGAWALISIGAIPVWLTLAYALQIWPGNALDVFRLALQMPTPDPLQTSGAAVRAALLLPKDVLTSVLEIDGLTLLVLAVGLTVAAVPAVTGRQWVLARLTGFTIVAIGAFAVAGVPVPLLVPEFVPFRIANAGVTTAALLVLAAAILASSRRRDGESISATHARTRWATVVMLAMLPFIFSFGSGNGIYAQASLAVGSTLLAGIVCVPRPLLGRAGLALAIAGSLAAVGFGAAALASGWQAPFRAAPLADQTTPTRVGLHGSTLLLEPRIAETIAELRDQGVAAGWSDGTPVVDVSYMWNPTIPYALGGRVPDFLALTIFGYPAAHDITDFHLSEPYRNFPFDRAWFVTSRPASISDPNGQAAVDFTMEKLSAVSGRPFPASYACVAAGDFILWRPVSSAEEAEQGCEG